MIEQWPIRLYVVDLLYQQISESMCKLIVVEHGNTHTHTYNIYIYIVHRTSKRALSLKLLTIGDII